MVSEEVTLPYDSPSSRRFELCLNRLFFIQLRWSFFSVPSGSLSNGALSRFWKKLKFTPPHSALELGMGILGVILTCCLGHFPTFINGPNSSWVDHWCLTASDWRLFWGPQRLPVMVITPIKGLVLEHLNEEGWQDSLLIGHWLWNGRSGPKKSFSPHFQVHSDQFSIGVFEQVQCICAHWKSGFFKIGPSWEISKESGILASFVGPQMHLPDGIIDWSQHDKKLLTLSNMGQGRSALEQLSRDHIELAFPWSKGSKAAKVG